jgi:transcriptional regulator with XRE-family HTH domain
MARTRGVRTHAGAVATTTRRKPKPTVAGATKPVPQPDGDDDANRWLGYQIRSLRLARAMSLQQLADKASLSIGMVSQLERGLVSPSVRSLRQISQALEVPTAYFFEQAQSPPREEIGRIVRLDARRTLHLSTTGMCKELLTPDTSGLLQLTLIRMQPAGSSGDEPYTHKGEDAGLVLSGAMRLFVGEDVHLLQPGDSFRFKSALPHRFQNAAEGVTEVVWAVTPPFY